MIQDLIQANVIHVDSQGKLLSRWSDEGRPHRFVWRITKEAGSLDQGSALVCWTVERNDGYLNADT